MQNLALASSLVVMAAIAAVFVWVAAGASRAADGGGAAAARRWRDRLFWVAIAGGVVLSFATLWNWPIAAYATQAGKPDVVIHAVASQWKWELDRDTVAPGQLVEFELTSKDVNHGFALYGDKTRMIAQAQTMPGYVNRLQVRFAEPGDYEVLCLEYCGLAHHAMRAVIKVRAGS